MRSPRLASTAALAATLLAAPLAGAPARYQFDTHWHDGKAELDGYRLTVERYGHPRLGRAVAIYVTEPFSRSKLVKVDDASKHPADTFDVLKLNLVRHFQTGIYDYNTMLSLFTQSTDFSPVKVTFGSGEWCGQVYDELNFRAGKVTEKYFSYFENESSERSFPAPAGGIVEDNLFILLRGLRGEFLAPGARRTAPFLPSPFYSRLSHRRPEWSPAVIERARQPETARVPAGSFAVWRYTVRPSDGRIGQFLIERDPPHRVVRWEWTAAPAAGRGLGGTDRGELTGTLRTEYWRLHDPGDERQLEALGLDTPSSPR